jgi:hypothetical protein
MSRDDDDFEDFEKLMDAGLQGRDLPAIERPVGHKQGPPSKRKSALSRIVDDGNGERSMDLTGNEPGWRPSHCLTSYARRAAHTPYSRSSLQSKNSLASYATSSNR